MSISPSLPPSLPPVLDTYTQGDVIGHVVMPPSQAVVLAWNEEGKRQKRRRCV